MATTAPIRAGVRGSIIVLLALLLPPAAHAASLNSVLISTVATGGSSASDEYVVIEAVGNGGTDIADYELMYTTASGATTRRLVSLESAAPLAAGERLLVANSLGEFATGAVATWSDGIAATGGSLRLRLRSNSSFVADAVAWGSATASAGGFGMPSVAMSSTTMIDRRRDQDGYLVNSQNNSADFALVPLASPIVTRIAPDPPAPTPTVTPTVAPTVSPSSSPSASPSPTTSPTPTASPAPTITPWPVVLTPTQIRTAQLGSTVTLVGAVSAAPGELAEQRLLCIEDPLTGVGVFLLAAIADTARVRGEVISVTGTVQLRRQALTLVATATAQHVGWAELMTAQRVAPPTLGPWAWEPWEGREIAVTGTVRGAVRVLAGGSRSVTLRLPGSGEILVGIGPALVGQIPDALLDAGATISVRGILHQRSGSAGGGYRLWALAVVASSPPAQTQGSLISEGVQPEQQVEGAAVLQVGTPSVALEDWFRPGWPEQIARIVEVRGGALVLVGQGGAGLVVLPALDAAQAVPGGRRAWSVVDRAGRAPYPQER